MSTSLDTILAGREAAPVQDTQEQTTPAAEITEAEGQSTEQQPEGQEGERTAEGGKQAPIGAIRQAEREKATKRYTEQVADFDKRLADTNAAWERRFETLVQTLGPKPEPKPAPDMFENPSGFVRHEMNGPISEVRGVLLNHSRYLAEMRYDETVVTEADTAFTKAVQARTIDPADYQRVLNSPNIYDAAVKWHRRQQAMQEIGDDPAKYREKVKAELMAELGAQPQTEDPPQQQQQQRVMPSNLAAARNVGSRAGPAWAGPKPLNDIFKR